MSERLPRAERLKLAVEWLSSKDENSRQLIKAVGQCNFTTIGSPFYVLVKSVIAQQLSSKVATIIENRIVQLLGGTQNFVDPETWLKIKIDDLRNCGVSFNKSHTIHSIADAYCKNELNDSFLESLPEKEVIKVLCSYKGIGPWTAEMTLIFALDRWDCFSIGDLGLRKGVEKWFGISKEDKKQIENFVGAFSPYRSILAWYLWAYFDSEPWS